MRRAAALLLLGALGAGLPLAAKGAPPPTAAMATPTAWAVAQSYWGAEPEACGSIAFSYTNDPAVLGWASRPLPGMEDVPCAVALRPGLPLRVECYVVVHEYGHLLGLDHSHDPGSIMAPTVNGAMGRGAVGGCESLARRAQRERCADIGYWPRQRRCIARWRLTWFGGSARLAANVN